MQSIASVEGGALGLLIVEDDEADREVPIEVRTAESINLIIQYHIPSRWNPPNPTASDFFAVNGLTNNPVLRLRRGKWLRFRLLTTSISFGNLLMSSWTIPAGVSCNVILIAKDGVYLKTPRRLSAPFNMIWSEASRADLMVRCDGQQVGQEIQVRLDSKAIFRIRLEERRANESADEYEMDFRPCLPGYLALDLSQETVLNPVVPLSLNAFMSFRGFAPSDAIGTFPVGSTIRLSLAGIGHPFHIHVNHFQIEQDSPDGWYKKGDWHDAAQGVDVRMRLDRFTELMLVHCHNIIHQEEVNTNGMMAVIWINGTDGSESSFAQTCPEIVELLPSTRSPTVRTPTRSPSTSFPSRAPRTSFPSRAPRTSRPSKAPSINVKCLGYSKDVCPSPRCYFHEPAPIAVRKALQRLSKTQRKACMKQLGCRPSTPSNLFCKYKCTALCTLDNNCRLRKIAGKPTCVPKQ